MKFESAIPAALVLCLASCDSMNRPISTGDFDPLRPPGSGLANTPNAGPAFTAGKFVHSIMDNTAFFNARPKGDADADKLLPRGTSMKVISADPSYVRVELDSGEVGWVPAVMVEDPSAAPGVTSGPFDATKPGEFQVYPPVMPPQGDAAPALPGDLPPEGAIPTVIDPEAFVAPTTDQATAPTTNEATAPAANAESQGTPSPLPPNGEDE